MFLFDDGCLKPAFAKTSESVFLLAPVPTTIASQFRSGHFFLHASTPLCDLYRRAQRSKSKILSATFVSLFQERW